MTRLGGALGGFILAQILCLILFHFKRIGLNFPSLFIFNPILSVTLFGLGLVWKDFFLAFFAFPAMLLLNILTDSEDFDLEYGFAVYICFFLATPALIFGLIFSHTI